MRRAVRRSEAQQSHVGPAVLVRREFVKGYSFSVMRSRPLAPSEVLPS
jgi:hypothetical protein